jgi:hypothetical protein
MENPVAKKDLVDTILELREEVEKRLQANKYYVAMNAKVNPENPAPEPEASVASEPKGESEKVWTGLVQESVVEGDALRAF